MTTEDILILCEHALKPYEGGDEAFKRVKTALEVYYDKQKVLDKIRAEIEQKIVRRSGLNHTRSERDRNDAFLEVLDIFDKYRAESEK